MAVWLKGITVCIAHAMPDDEHAAFLASVGECVCGLPQASSCNLHQPRSDEAMPLEAPKPRSGAPEGELELAAEGELLAPFRAEPKPGVTFFCA